MDVAATLGRIEEQFEGGDPHGALGELGELVAEVAPLGVDVRTKLLTELVARVGHEQPALGAHFALAAGALVEGGLDPEELAEALVEPVARAVVSARRFVELAERYPDEPGAMEGDDDAVEVGERTLSGESLAAIADEDDDAVASYFALDTWHHPVLTAWTRHTDSLAAAQSDPAIGAALDELAGRSEGAQWLAMLMRVPIDAPLVVLVPEAEAGFSMRMTGVADVAQLLVLVAEALPEATLARLGATKPSAEVVSVMRGAGPQQLDTSWETSLRLHPWQAIDPATGLPARASARWSLSADAPHEADTSLADTASPAEIGMFGGGTRVAVLVGSGKPRAIAAGRTFPALLARLGSVEALSADEVAAYRRKLSAAKSS